MWTWRGNWGPSRGFKSLDWNIGTQTLAQTWKWKMDVFETIILQKGDLADCSHYNFGANTNIGIETSVIGH